MNKIILSLTVCYFCLAKVLFAQNISEEHPFVTVWQTENLREDPDNPIISIETNPVANYNYTVD